MKKRFKLLAILAALVLPGSIAAAQTPPGTVQGLSGAALGVSSITWSWQAVEGADGYAVFYNGVLVSSGTALSFLSSGLEPNSMATVCVEAYNTVGADTRACLNASSLAAVPGVPEVTGVGDTSISLKWSPAGNEPGTDYDLRGSTDNFETMLSTPVLFRWNDRDDVVHTVPGLEPDTTYYARVGAINGDNIPTAYSGVISAKTAIAAPGAPTDLTAEYDAGSRKVLLFWSSATSGTHSVSYNIYQARSPYPGFIPVGSAQDVHYEDPLRFSATYYYKVSALNSDGIEGPYSEVFPIFVDAEPPAMVYDLRVSSIADSSATLSWTAPADDSGLAYYVLRMSESSQFDWDSAVFVATVPAAGGVESFVVTPGSTDTVRFYALKAFDAADNASQASNSAVVDFMQPVLVVDSPVAEGGTISRPIVVQLAVADNYLVNRLEFLVDGIIVSSPALGVPQYNFSFITNPADYADGSHVFNIRAFDQSGNLAQWTRSAIVSYVPPAVPVITYPSSGFSQVPSHTYLTGTTDPGIFVAIFVNGNFAASAQAGAEGQFYAPDVPLGGDGAVSITAQAFDGRGASPRTGAVTGMVDSGPPGAPVSVSAQSAANGRVALAWAAAPGEVPAFYNIYRATPEEPLVSTMAAQTLRVAPGITALEYTDTPGAEGDYYYAVSAVDAAGNESALSAVSLANSDAQPPSAEITLPGATPPLGAGNHLVRVTATEVLSQTPYLTFTPAGANPVQLSLEPSTTTNVWLGTLTVTQAMPSGTGVFAFQGVDLSGNAGQEITSGGTLALETEGPVATITVGAQTGLYLSTGTYPVTLALNKPVAATPELWFTVAGGTRAVQLSPVNDAAHWAGALAVSAATGEGAHYFSYSVFDRLGNTGTLIAGATYFMVDTIAPGAPFSLNGSPGAGGTVNIGWSAPLSDERPTAYCLYRNAQLVTCAITPRADLTGLYTDTPAQGSYTYNATALDAAGNESVVSNSTNVVTDATPPEPPVITSALADSSVNLVWSPGGVETPERYRLYRTTYPVTSAAGFVGVIIGTTATNTPASDGVYYYAVTALDAVDNESALSTAAVVSYSGAAPVITISGVVEGGQYNSAVRPVFTAWDLNPGVVSALLNNSAFVSGSAVSAVADYTLVIIASDTLNHTSSKIINFTIDKTSPAVTLAGVADGGYYETAVAPVISVSEAHLSTVTARLNDFPYISGSTIAENGAYTLLVTAADLAGNVGYGYAAFTVNRPPQKTGALTAVIEDGAAAALSWAPYAGAVGYKVYKDGAYLAQVSAVGHSYRDTAYTGAAAHVYEILAVDINGREGMRTRAELPALALALAGYGTFLDNTEALNRGFFDSVRFTVTNNGAQAIQAGPLALTVGGEQAIPAPAATITPGASTELSAVVYTSTSAAGSLSARAVLSLPQGGDAVISMVLNIPVKTRAPLAPVVEVYPDALVRGAYSRVKVKFNNRGSAPVDIITARQSGATVVPSSAVAVGLNTQAGFTLSRGELLQTANGAAITFLNGQQVYFVSVAAGASFLSEPVNLAVPELSDAALNVTGGVYGMYYSLPLAPVAAQTAFTASLALSSVGSIPYTATVAPERQAYDKGQTVKLTGTARDSVTGVLLGWKKVLITVQNHGFERTISTTTLADGTFTSQFTPATGESGIYYLSASYPYAVSRLTQSTFSVTGLEFGYAGYTLTLAQGSSYNFDVPLINSGETSVTGLAVTFESVPSSITLAAQNAPVEIEAGARKQLTVKATASMDLGSYSAILKLREANGFERSIPLYIKVVPAQVIPKLTPQTFEIGLLGGDTRTQSITVENIGFSTWTGVNISTPSPSWVKVQGSQQLGDLAPGENIHITLLIQPPAGMANGSYAEPVFLQSSNYGNVPINPVIRVTSSRKGNAYFTVASADVAISTPATGRIGGVTMQLTSLDVAGLVFTVKSDANGLARFEEVPSGKYNYKAEATGYNPVTGQLNIEPGVTSNLNVFMPTSMVTYKWSVTPTSITDKYDITLDMTFRTDVPAPALIIDPPDFTFNMAAGQILYTQFTIKNKGLVSAFNVKFTEGSSDPAMKLEYALTEIAELKAGQTVVVPVKITLIHASCHEAKKDIEYRYFCASLIDSIITVPGPVFKAGDAISCGGGVALETPFGQQPEYTAPAAAYVATAVMRSATVKSCSSGPGVGGPSYGKKTECQKAVAGMSHTQNSLGIDWWLYYDSLLNKFWETTGWTIEEQSDGSVIITDDEGNQVTFVPKGKFAPELTGVCGQYKDVPGYNVQLAYSGGMYKVAQKSGKNMEFSKHGDKYQPDLIKDSNNTTLSYTYNPAGRVQTITDVHGRTMNFAYDALGRKTGVSDFTNRQMSLAYDSNGRLNSITDIDGSVNTYSYDASNRMSAINYGSGAHEYMVYDSTGRIISSSEDNDNNKKTFVYDDVSSTTLVTDILGHQTLYNYMVQDGRREITKITGPDGAITSYEYDSNFNRTKITDALTRETGMVYSYYSNLLSVTDPLGNTTAMRYGIGSMAEGNVGAISNSYAANNDIAQQAGCTSGSTQALKILEPYSLANDAPYLTQVTDPKGNATQMDYGLNGNMIEVKDTQNNKTQLFYDAQGHVTGTKDPLNNVSRFEYDTLGALAKVTDPLGRITQLTRNNLSLVMQTKDPKNKLTLFEYDVLSNLAKVIDAINGITEYTYTNGGCPSCGTTGSLLATVKDAKQHTTSFAYDLQKRLTGVTNPVGNTKTFEYNKKGFPTKITDAKGQIVALEYDVNDRLTVKHLPEGDVTYEYDIIGNPLSITSPEGVVSWVYDAANRMTQTTQRFPIYSAGHTITYAYDANGNQTRMTSEWGTTSYTYDTLNRLTALTNPDNKVITFAYDAAGSRTRMTYPNGTETTYAYDAASQLTQLLSRRTADNTAIAFANYQYDEAGNRTSMEDTNGTHSYQYDDLYRLTSANHPASSAMEPKVETYAYDQVGNRISDAAITNYQYDNANRLLENSSYTYTYDANGSRITEIEKNTGKHTTYAYTSENQLKQATMPDGTIAIYKYDPLGRRIEKSVTKNFITTKSEYIYDGYDAVAMLNDNGSGFVFTYDYGIDKPLIMKSGTANYYYHADELGSIVALTNDVGSTVEKIEYQAYGMPTVTDQDDVVLTRSSVENPFLFTASIYDPETGFYDHRARERDARTGGFIQEDPLGFDGGDVNFYAYVWNNPQVYTDPTGEFGVVGAIGGAMTGMGTEIALQAAGNKMSGRGALDDLDWGQIFISGGWGALIGGSGFGLVGQGQKALKAYDTYKVARLNILARQAATNYRRPARMAEQVAKRNLARKESLKASGRGAYGPVLNRGSKALMERDDCPE